MTTLDAVLALPDADFAAAVAEEVMGWKKKASGFYWDTVAGRTRMIWGSDFHDARKRIGIKEDDPQDEFVFCPQRCPADDYRVLERVREWKCGERENFAHILYQIWGIRRASRMRNDDERVMYYEPGDYAAAALAAVRETKG